MEIDRGISDSCNNVKWPQTSRPINRKKYYENVRKILTLINVLQCHQIILKLT